jgi:hypothetical protein
LFEVEAAVPFSRWCEGWEVYQIVPFESKKGVRVAEGNNLNLLKSDFVRSPPKLNRTSWLIFGRIWNVVASIFGLDTRCTSRF